MSPFEHDLHEALKPVEPPPGFTSRVMARVEARRARRRFLWAAIAALLLVTIGIGYQRELERRRGLEAKQQLMRGLQITGQQLRDIRSHILNEVSL